MNITDIKQSVTEIIKPFDADGGKLIDEIIDLIIDQRLDERSRAIKIAYEFREEHLKNFESRRKAGSQVAFVEKEQAETARYIGNTISGHNALTITLNISDKDLLKEELGIPIDYDKLRG